ncbi:MAG: hypothetical protein GX750_09115 [Clostridia bacterium]|nr:hypothetical protein [Clostridia bacterium]
MSSDNYAELRAGVLPVDEATGVPICPPPRELLSIRVQKVYNECKNTEVKRITIPIDPPVRADEVECSKAWAENICCEKEDSIVTVTYDLHVSFKLLKDKRVVTTITEVIPNQTRSFGLARACDKGLRCEVDVYPEALLCEITCSSSAGYVSEVTCCVGVLYWVRLVAPVQVLIPSFGYSPEPPECEAVGGLCPDFKPKWPPYPPDGPYDDGCGCGC